MKKTLIISFGLLALILNANAANTAKKAAPAPAPAAPSVPTEQSNNDSTEHSFKKPVSLERSSALSLEILGRGGLYSLNYDKSLSDSLGLGLGLSAYSASAAGVSASIVLIPVYVNYYFSPNNHRGFISGGLDIYNITAKIDSFGSVSGTGAFAVVGGGYEYRGDGGFLFRAAPYFLVAGKVAVTLGLSFGAAF